MLVGELGSGVSFFDERARARSAGDPVGLASFAHPLFLLYEVLCTSHKYTRYMYIVCMSMSLHGMSI